MDSANQSYLQSADFRVMNVLDILALEEPKEKQDEILEQMENIAFALFVAKDLPQHLTPEEVAEINKLKQEDLEKAVLLTEEKLAAKSMRMEELLEKRALTFKYDFILEHVEVLKEAAKQISNQMQNQTTEKINSLLIEIEERIQENKWREIPELMKEFGKTLQAFAGQ